MKTDAAEAFHLKDVDVLNTNRRLKTKYFFKLFK